MSSEQVMHFLSQSMRKLMELLNCGCIIMSLYSAELENLVENYHVKGLLSLIPVLLLKKWHISSTSFLFFFSSICLIKFNMKNGDLLLALQRIFYVSGIG